MYQNSPLRYKVVLEIGVIYLDQMDPRSDQCLQEYKQFIKKHSKKEEKNAEIGKAYNVLGLRQLRKNELEDAREYFESAVQELKIYGG